MSTNSYPPLRKRKETTKSTSTPDGDHRKRRRNRTTQSCVNCHAAKRMCNRKRPACLRCTTLGLTGLCVYEVDDPSQKDVQQDEALHLRDRVAELESVIRELKNKPHPRWAQKTLVMKDGVNPRSSQNKEGTSNSELIDIPASPTAPTASSSDAGGTPRTPPSEHAWTPPADTSPIHLPLPNLLSLDSLTPLAASQAYKNLDSLAAPYIENTPSPRISGFINDVSPQSSIPTTPWTENSPLSFNSAGLSSAISDAADSEDEILSHIFEQIIRADEKKSTMGFDCQGTTAPGPCSCLGNTITYNTILELSLHLRTASQMLGQLSEHFPGTDCALFTKIAELDILASTAVWDTVTSERHEEQNPPFDKFWYSQKAYEYDPDPTITSMVSVSIPSEPLRHPQNWEHPLGSSLTSWNTS